MIGSVPGERRERVVSWYISRFDTLEEVTLRCMEDPA